MTETPKKKRVVTDARKLQVKESVQKWREKLKAFSPITQAVDRSGVDKFYTPDERAIAASYMDTLRTIERNAKEMGDRISKRIEDAAQAGDEEAQALLETLGKTPALRIEFGKF